MVIYFENIKLLLKFYFFLARYKPPGNIASINYPSLGPYSSSNPSVIEQHMKWLSSAGVDVVVASWYPKEKSESEGILFIVLLGNK